MAPEHTGWALLEQAWAQVPMRRRRETFASSLNNSPPIPCLAASCCALVLAALPPANVPAGGAWGCPHHRPPRGRCCGQCPHPALPGSIPGGPCPVPCPGALPGSILAVPCRAPFPLGPAPVPCQAPSSPLRPQGTLRLWILWRVHQGTFPRFTACLCRWSCYQVSRAVLLG